MSCMEYCLTSTSFIVVCVCSEIGAVVVLFGCARCFEGAIPFPDVKMMIVFGVLGFVGMFINQVSHMTSYISHMTVVITATTPPRA